jgi:hypothetical protein
MLDTLQSGVQSIEPDVRHALPSIAPALWEQIFAAAYYRRELETRRRYSTFCTCSRRVCVSV